MSSLCICGADFSGIERNPYCQIHGENGSKSKPVSLNCDADHCTPEERAVIEAAIRFRETSIALHAYFDSNEPDTEGLGVYPLAEASEAAGKSFKIACEALLAARAGKETG